METKAFWVRALISGRANELLLRTLEILQMIGEVRIYVFEELRIRDWDTLIILEAKMHLNTIFMPQLGFVMALRVLTEEYVHLLRLPKGYRRFVVDLFCYCE